MSGPWFANDQPISNESLLAMVPAVGASQAHSSVSKRYGFVPTIAVVKSLQHAGFDCVGAKQARTRRLDKQGFQKHVLQFTLNKFKSVNVGDDRGDIRIVISNSHDGGGSYQGSLGLYRHRCLNSLITMLSFGCFRVRHHQNAAAEVIDATYRILDDIPRLEEHVTKYQRIMIPFEKQQEFAERAIELRWGKDAAPFGPDALIVARRDADQGDDLWRVFNRVQENLVRGHVPYEVQVEGKTRRRHTREVTSPIVDLQLNRGLWALAEEYAQ